MTLPYLASPCWKFVFFVVQFLLKNKQYGRNQFRTLTSTGMPKKHSHFTNQYLAESSQKLCDSKTWALNSQVEEKEANKIMHIALPIGQVV